MQKGKTTDIKIAIYREQPVQNVRTKRFYVYFKFKRREKPSTGQAKAFGIEYLQRDDI